MSQAALAAALSTSAAMAAEPAPDLALYDCTRVDDGKAVRGEELIATGFKIVSVGRFGQPNVMLADPRTGVRANCLVRPEAPK